MTNEKVAILCGGGLDSATLLPYMCKGDPDFLNKVVVFHIDYGQKSAFAEREAVKLQMCEAGLNKSHFVPLTLDMSFSGAAIMKGTKLEPIVQSNNRVELRNPLFLMYVASYMASNYPDCRTRIYIGLHKEPDDCPYPDGLYKNYFKSLQKTISGCLPKGVKVTVHAPFKHTERINLLRKLIEYHGMEHVLSSVHSCYEAQTCGVCTHCVHLHSMINEVSKSLEPVEVEI